MYSIIDMKKTGKKLKRLFGVAGYSVKEIQDYLQLSCPQPVYRWFKGKTLPTVNHLYAMSELLGLHMEELLVVGRWNVLECERRYERIKIERCRDYSLRVECCLADFITQVSEK